MGTLRIEELSATTVVAANTLTLKKGQEQFIAPASYAVAEAYFSPGTEWPRVVIDGDTVVGFIRGHFDEASSQPYFKSCLWRLHIAADSQGKGVGTFAVNALAEEAKSRGFDAITVLWDEGDEGPGDFFTKMGFAEIGRTPYGEVIGEKKLG